MSKNVAVFVDVANIFYAAKAGGVDIDYVTLLKSATAGRDFVRAYAYTGLDPENENQRQFHAFLARNGYKVVSKDIRKYGDGRIKANLDIELVVDLMRLARNLDIAVVVSGDGDFAPAIRAVQEMGVRVEVISFRGNTSADLIEVADQFTDIAQIARVEKASARSGRRVAAEGDLSMTAVPEKETEGAPRRRRGRTAAERVAAERVAAEPAEAAGMAGNLIVLPGERLSRAPEGDEAEAAEEAAAEAGGEGLAAEGEEGDRRRRRRRGGRGRGRGRRDEAPPEERAVAAEAGIEEEEEEEFEEVVPAQLPHHTFGSVWDSQLGVPSTLPSVTAYEGELEEEDLEEPEVPEYLLAERRQRQRGGGGGGRGRIGRGGRQGAYQAAIERERYGRTGGGGFGGPRSTERPRPERRRGQPGGQRPPRHERPTERRQPPTTAQQQPPSSGEPWTEVPAELEEMLRAELARKGAPEPAPRERPERPSEPRGRPAAEATMAQPEEEAAAEVKPKRATRARTPRVKAEAAAETTVEPTAAEAKPKRASRARPTSPTADDTEKPKRPTRSRAKAAADEAQPAVAPEAAAGAEESKPVRRRRTKASETPAEG